MKLTELFYGRRMAEKCAQCLNACSARECTRVHQTNGLGWLAGARAGDFQQVFLLGNVGHHARSAFSL